MTVSPLSGFSRFWRITYRCLVRFCPWLPPAITGRASVVPETGIPIEAGDGGDLTERRSIDPSDGRPMLDGAEGKAADSKGHVGEVGRM